MPLNIFTIRFYCIVLVWSASGSSLTKCYSAVAPKKTNNSSRSGYQAAVASHNFLHCLTHFIWTLTCLWLNLNLLNAMKRLPQRSVEISTLHSGVNIKWVCNKNKTIKQVFTKNYKPLTFPRRTAPF